MGKVLQRNKVERSRNHIRHGKEITSIPFLLIYM
jgi:hypothetical protein